MSDGDLSPRPRPGGTSSVNWLLVILLILLTAFVWRGMGRKSPLLDPNAAEPPIVARGDLAEDEKSTIELFRKASKSVVHITTLAVQQNITSMEYEGIPQGTGTGFVWDENGYVVTNYHVIESAEAARVTLYDRTDWNARLVGVAPDKDVAVLKIDAPAEKLHPLKTGRSENLQVGQKVFAIGNPFGLDQTLTTGVISGLGREILSVTKRPIQGVIQTDAAINPGNSGGPLLDSAGLLIGVNTAIYSPSGGNTGVGFAVPVDTVRWIVPQLIRHGKVERVGMGIVIFDDRAVALAGLRGVLIREVRPGSPAEAAGLLPSKKNARGQYLPGDLIVAVNGESVKDSIDLYRQLDQLKAGETVQVKIRRGKEDLVVPVELRVLD